MYELGRQAMRTSGQDEAGESRMGAPTRARAGTIRRPRDLGLGCGATRLYPNSVGSVSSCLERGGRWNDNDERVDNGAARLSSGSSGSSYLGSCLATTVGRVVCQRGLRKSMQGTQQGQAGRDR